MPLRDFIIGFEDLWNLLPCGWDIGVSGGKKKKQGKFAKRH